MPVLCLLYTYSKAEEERRTRLADLLGRGSGIVDTPSYTSRVVKIFSDTVYILYCICKATYIRLVPFQARYKSRIYSFHLSETFKIEEMTCSPCCY